MLSSKVANTLVFVISLWSILVYLNLVILSEEE